MRLTIVAFLFVACAGCQHTSNRTSSESVGDDPVQSYPEYHVGKSYSNYLKSRGYIQTRAYRPTR